MSHLFIRYVANSTSQHNKYPCNKRDFDANTMLHHESRCAFDGSVGLALSYWCAISLANATIAGSLSHLIVVTKLINELRCSLRNPWTFSPFSRDQHRHIILCLLSRMTSTRVTCSSVHRHKEHPFQIIWSIRSPVRRVHTASHLLHDLYGRCVVMCFWFSLAVGCPGSRMFLTGACCHRIPSLRLPRPRPINSMPFISLFALNALSHTNWHSQCSSCPRSLLLPSRNGLL